MYPIEKIFRDMRLLRTYECTSEVQHLILAGHLFSTYRAVMPRLDEVPVSRRKGEGADSVDARKRKIEWRCPVCGYVHRGDKPPGECPYCFVKDGVFKKLAMR